MATLPESSRTPTELQVPGALRSETYLTLQTRRAQLMVQGRPQGEDKQQIVGLTHFAALTRSVWNGALADDPYAHWWLLRMHQTIEDSTAELKALTTHLEQLLQTIPGVTVTVAQSVEPVRIPLTFTNPFGFRGAYLLAHYDEAIRRIMTARHVALLDSDRSEHFLTEAGRHVRRAYNSVLRYRFLGINSDDIRLMTARGKEAEALLGTLPVEVLDGLLRAPHAPNPRARAFAIPFALRRRPAPASVEPGPALPSDGAGAALSDGTADAPAP